MKKIYNLLLITLLIVGISACKKDSTETTNKKKIVGKWYVNTIKTTTFKNNALLSKDTTTYTDKSAYIQFNSDATGRTQDGPFGYNFSYSINGENVTLTNVKIDGNANGTIDVDDVPSTLSITAITSTSLNLHEETSYKILTDTYQQNDDTYLSK
ncbi:lipocalin-like domain-containing protein [Mucilaginibacter sp. SP1R1]|uniref:lipocalin-like domain-containing protein n=1 Tax=Mucilaginibacter sp. SP1R1 TaxID=2723091 RepID=UPI00161CF9AE|nr:lipocalin-like domain-containing protein [Mucilaginibacter sp. SP1R1]MBB6149510.1 hypothetical protein [Mucilaginibacter sp. SP1R1]